MLTVLIIALVIILLYIFLICPRMSRKEETKSFKDSFYAHRGLFDNENGLPENSMPAFDKAIKNGYGIEFDVHVTRDKKCVVFHDDNLKRMAGIDKKISDMTFDEIKNVKLLNTNIGIPSLDEVLSLVNGQVPLIIEIKSLTDSLNEANIIQQKLDNYKGKFCVESFNPLVLLWYKKNRRDIIRGQLSTDYIKDSVSGSRMRNFMLTYLLLNVLSRPDFIAYNIVHKKNMSFRMCTKIMDAAAFAWTVRSQADYISCREYFDIFIFQDFKLK